MIAAALLLAAQSAVAATGDPASYEGLVSRAVAEARGGDRGAAEALLSRARALDPARPEALVELAGLRFLDARYADAVALLRPALRRGADAHARDLLATSLYLAGRPDEAVEAWNPLRRPVLRNLRIEGMHDTRARLVVPQLALVEGALVTRDQLRETRLRLHETGAFDRVALRTVPLETGEADVELALVERRGFGSPPELAAQTLSKALQRTAFLRYDNLGGTGIGARASYRWQSSQPRAEVTLAWPRPLGIGATLLAQGEWERAQYELDGSRLRLEARGGALGLRRVLGPRTVGELRWEGRRRTFTGEAAAAIPAARPGLVSGVSLRAEHVLVDDWRHRLVAVGRVFGAAGVVGSELGFATTRVAVRDVVFLSAPDRTTIERSVVAAQFVWGQGTAQTPLDAQFVPGAASEMDLPLRAYRDRRAGVLGRTPIGRSLWLLNLEWRRRIARWGPLQAGAVFFYDAARASGTVSDPGQPFLHDLGAGLRLGVLDVLVRMDYAVSLSSPSARAFTAGLGQAF